MATPVSEPIAAFETEKAERIALYPADTAWRQLSLEWIRRGFEQRYMYNFAWMGRPIIQLPGDMVALQEVIWQVKPDLIIETGIAHGGSLILSASMLALLDYCEAVEANTVLDPRQSRRRVLGVDIDIRAHNKAAIQAHPLAHRIDMLEGPSTAPETISKVLSMAKDYRRILVCLDSNHTHEHVLAELNAYAPLVSVNSYCIVFDTIIEDLPAESFPDRPWSKGNNARTAVREYLQQQGTQKNQSSFFEIDATIDNKLMISAAPGGFLKRVR